MAGFASRFGSGSWAGAVSGTGGSAESGAGIGVWTEAGAGLGVRAGFRGAEQV